jgi:hypothetical protein
MEKKPWQTPKLTILTRIRPEEAVLTSCKLTAGGGGPGGNSQGCGTDAAANCSACQSRASSGS